MQAPAGSKLNTSVRNSHALLYWLWLTSLQGFAALIPIFRVQSMDRNAWFLGYSAERIALAAAIAVPASLLMALAIRATTHRAWLGEWTRRLGASLTAERHFNLLCLLTFSLVVGFAMIMFLSSPILGETDVHRVLFARGWTAIVWGTVAAAQAALAILLAYPDVSRRPGYPNREWVRRNLLLGLVGLAVLLQWAILYFRLEVFSRIPNWYWWFRERHLRQAWLFIPLSAVALLLARIVLERSHRAAVKIVLLVVLGYLLQVGFGGVEGDGWQSLRGRYVRGGRPIYSEVVTTEEFSFGSLLEYERHWSDVYSLAAKPPGYLAVYGLANAVANPERTASNHTLQMQRLTTFMAVWFPLLALAVIPVLHSLGRRLLGNQEASIAALIYLSFPGFILLTLQLDQVVFPLLAALTMYSAVSSADSRSLARKAMTGLLAYVGLYFSLTLVLVLPLVLLWELFYSLAFSRDTWLRSAARGMAGFSIGLLAGYIAFRTLLHYDIAARALHAMQFIAGTPHAPASLSMKGPTILLDSAEMAMWLGCGAIILLLSQGFASVAAWRKRAPTKLDALVVSGMALIPVLVATAPARGEVARLSLFLQPLIALALARSLLVLGEGKPRLVYGFIASQWVTALLILKFQLPWQ